MKAIKVMSAFIVLFFITSCVSLNAQTKIRIGIYDSRVIAVAYYNSKYFSRFPEQGAKMKTAKEKNDSVEISKINKEMELRQRMMHEQGFGKGSVCDLMFEIKDKIKEFAKTEKLNIVVSKWELNYGSSDAELIDVTVKIAKLFESTMDAETMYSECQKNSPEPIKEAFLLED